MAYAKALTHPSYRLDEQIGYILRLASQRHSAIFQRHSIYNLTPTQFSALIRLAEVGECSQNKLGRLAAMDVATIKGVVDRLKKKGLVSVVADASDRRRMLISLTPVALEIIPELQQTGFEISRGTMASLNEKEQQLLLGLLGKLT